MHATVIDLMGRPAPWPPEALELWQACSETATRTPKIWRTSSPEGDDQLREALGGILDEDPSNLIITIGVRAACSVLVAPGTGVVLERPSFADVATVLKMFGAQVCLRSWEDMMSPSGGNTDTVYWITAPARNPDGMMPPIGLLEALEAQMRLGARVIVNEVYRWYDTSPTQLVAAIRVGSLAKIATGGAKVGWIRASSGLEPSLIERNVAPPPRFWQRIWALFLLRGGLELLHKNCVTRAAEAKTVFVDTVNVLLGDVLPCTTGPSILVPLAAYGEEEVITELQTAGLLVSAGKHFLVPYPSIRLSFTDTAPDQAEEAAIRFVALARCWHGDKASTYSGHVP